LIFQEQKDGKFNVREAKLKKRRQGLQKGVDLLFNFYDPF
jgi:hypothetical protein